MSEEQKILPEGWRLVKIDDVAKLLRGVTYKKDQASNSEKNGFLPVLRANNINGQLNFDDLVYVPAYLINDAQHIRKGDIIFAMSSGSRHLVGKSAIAKQDFNGSYGAFCGLLRVTPTAANIEYVGNYFKGNKFRKYISEIASGTNINNLKREHLLDLEIPLPPLYSQQSIVSKIEELFSELDNGVAQLKTAQQQLNTYRQSVLKWAFEGRLTNKNVQDGELPEGWEWVKIEDFLFDPKKGMTTGPFGSMLKKHEHTLDGIAVLGIENIGEGVFQMPNKIFITEAKAEQLKRYEVEEDDVIISRSGTVGEICSVPLKMTGSLISTNLMRVRLNRHKILAKYFVYMFQGGAVKEQVKELCKGSTRVFLNQKILNAINFPFCNYTEQIAVIDEIERRLSVADKLQETITAALAQSEALRQSILKQAFEGRLVKN